MNPRALLYWLVVAVPLACSVLLSVNTALPLFGAKPVAIPYLTVATAKPVAQAVATPTAPASAVPPALAIPDASTTPAR